MPLSDLYGTVLYLGWKAEREAAAMAGKGEPEMQAAPGQRQVFRRHAPGIEALTVEQRLALLMKDREERKGNKPCPAD